MRSFLLLTIVLITAVGYSQQAVFYCSKKSVKFPKMKEGEQLSWSYLIENKGQSPLVIYNVEVECTCTEVTLPEVPIIPGKTAEIKVKFSTEGRPFYQDRIILLNTNSKKKKETLKFKVYVIPKEVG